MTSKKPKDHKINISGLDALMQEAEANIEKMEVKAGLKEEDDMGDPANWDLENMDLGAIEVLTAPSGPPSATENDEDAQDAEDENPASKTLQPLKKQAAVSPIEETKNERPPENPSEKEVSSKEEKASAQDVVVQAMLKEKNRMVLVISRLEQEKKSYRLEKDEFKDDLIRVQANFENFKKRVTRDKKEVHKYAQDEVFKELLEVADNLDRATQIDLSEATDKGRELAEKVLDGVHMTMKTMEGTLRKFNVETFSALDSFFDPNFHDAVQQVEDDTVPEGWVLEEFQKGYRQEGRLVRPCMVVVSTGGISRKEWEALHAPAPTEEDSVEEEMLEDTSEGDSVSTSDTGEDSTSESSNDVSSDSDHEAVTQAPQSEDDGSKSDERDAHIEDDQD